MTLKTAIVWGAAGSLAIGACSRASAPPGAPSAAQVNVSGAWNGTLADSQGSSLIAWNVTQSGMNVSGTAVMKPIDPDDGSCASCHKHKRGTFTGTMSGAALTFAMAFDGGSDNEPTPACNVTIDGGANGATDARITGTYSGNDSCEGLFANGRLEMVRQP